jgi:seryl-tRNA synthetase
MLEEIVGNAERIMEALEVPWRVVDVCAGDLGAPPVRKIDIETWMPSRGNYGETHSASAFHEFQARRLRLRYRDSGGKVRFCHTLNGTAVATPRSLLSVMECHQRPDGTIAIPAALRDSFAGRALIEPARAPAPAHS